MKNIIKKISLISLCAAITSNACAAEKVSEYKITSQTGTIGCIEKDDFRKVIEYAVAKKPDPVHGMIQSGECFLLEKGAVLHGEPNICEGKPDQEIVALKTTRMPQPLFIPCATIRKPH